MPNHISIADEQRILRLRLMLAVTGAIGGYAFWALFNYLPDTLGRPRVLILMTGFAAGFFGGLLLLFGRLPAKTALVYAAGLGLGPALLLYWASFRFLSAYEYTNSWHPLFAYCLLVLLAVPFILAQETAARGWRDYEGLFDQAWSSFVRGATAWAFVGLFWLVLLLADALLSLVSFPYLGDLLEHPYVSLPLSWLVLGLALAVLHELGQVVSTLRRLALQLLRLLLPLVAVVVALFIVLVPFQGLDKVFGSLSAAATMLAMAAGAVTLITAAVDARDDDTARSRVMVISAKALSVLLPLIAGIAVYAVFIRVQQYGWTPQRLAGGILSVIVLLYALGYGISVLAGAHWRDHIRTANTSLALAVIALSGLWLTPVLNAERIAANDQFARFQSGKTDIANLDLWLWTHEWGKAGESALSRLKLIKDHAEQAELDDKLQRLAEATSKGGLRRDEAANTKENRIAGLKDLLPVLPMGSQAPEGLIADIPNWVSFDVVEGCDRLLPDGRAGCALVIGSFDASGERKAGVLIWRDKDSDALYFATIQQALDGASFEYQSVARGRVKANESNDAEAILVRILDGEARFVPVTLNAFAIGDLRILPARP